jgi:hypothetical protein
MSHKSPIMGYKENPKNRNKHTLRRNVSTLDNTGPTHLDAIVLGMDPEPKHSMAET